MTYEEAKEVLSDCIKHEGYSCDCKFSRECTSDKKTALKKVFEALEKQIPMKPIIDFQPSGDCYLYCPTCNEVVKSHITDTPILNEYNHNHCGGCGQAIDWSES